MEITLRQYQVSDVNDFMGWACDPEVLRYSVLKHWIHSDSSKEDILNYFTQVVFPHPWYRAICYNGQPIGYICIKPAGTEKRHRGRATISSALGRSYWSRGIVNLATRKAVATAFKDLPHLNRIEAFVIPTNKAAQRTLEKAGFLREGVLRNYFPNINGDGTDFIVYSFLPTDLINAKL